MALTKADVLRIQATPPSHYDNIKEGPISTVARAWISMKNGEPQWIVIKSAPVVRKFSREPHDIRKELRILMTLSHPNIVDVLGSYEDDEDSPTLKVYMPYLPISLAELLASPFFSPHPFPPQRASSSPSSAPAQLLQHEREFTTIARSIIVQILCAIAYLHDDQRLIAHRDLKPENVLITKEGCVKLIDFGVSWKEKEPGYAKQYDLWPEYKGKLYFEVCTGAYRAPELLFGCRVYDPIAVDLWSLGATIAEFFTPLRLSSDDMDDDGDDDDDHGNCGDDDGIGGYGDHDNSDDHYDYYDGDANGRSATGPTLGNGETNNREAMSSSSTPSISSLVESALQQQPFVIPRYLRIGYPGAQWHRGTLFNGDRGEIGLAWSIFKIYGTPTVENWPEFDDLPGAKSVVFNMVPAVPVEPLLPNLPPSTRTSSAYHDPPLDVWPSTNGTSTVSGSTTNSHHAHSSHYPSETSASNPNYDHYSSDPSTLSHINTSDPSNSHPYSNTDSAYTSPVHPGQTTPRAYKHPALNPHRAPTPFDLLSRFLVYPSKSRQTASEALRHPWIVGGGVGPGLDSREGNGLDVRRDSRDNKDGGVLVPVGYNGLDELYGVQSGGGGGRSTTTSPPVIRTMYEWRGKSLGEWVHSMLLAIPGSANSEHQSRS